MKIKKNKDQRKRLENGFVQVDSDIPEPTQWELGDEDQEKHRTDKTIGKCFFFKLTRTYQSRLSELSFGVYRVGYNIQVIWYNIFDWFSLIFLFFCFSLFHLSIFFTGKNNLLWLEKNKYEIENIPLISHLTIKDTTTIRQRCYKDPTKIRRNFWVQFLFSLCVRFQRRFQYLLYHVSIHIYI